MSTLPSQNSTCAPPWWKLKISLLGPQFELVQRQPGGPPGGSLLLLIGDSRLPGVELLGPEMPMPLSGSAQRLAERLLLGGAGSAFLPCVTVGSGAAETMNGNT